MKFNTPILMIAFNRPDFTQAVFTVVQKVRPNQLFFAVDGPRNDADLERVEQVKEIIKQVDWDCEVKTLFQEQNLGCKLAVSSAIDWFFKNVEQGIILEDDCLPALSFFGFCEKMLERYQNNGQIGMIAGSNFQHGEKRGEASYYFSKYSYIWGWATWRRAWKDYDLEMKSWREFKNTEEFKKLFPNQSERIFWINAFDKMSGGRADTWDFQWSYANFINHRLCIVPNVNLISNLGISNEATHAPMHHLSNLPTAPIDFDNLIHPQLICPNQVADQEAYQQVYQRKFGKVKDLIKSILPNKLLLMLKK